MFKHILVYVYFEFIYSYFVPAFRVFVPPGAKGWLDHQKRGSNRCTSSLCGPVHSFVVRQHFFLYFKYMVISEKCCFIN